MKKNIMIISATIILGVFSIASSAFAGWYTVTVDKVGGTSSGVRVQVTDVNNAFTARWFELSGSKSDQLLASVLTAVSLDKKLSIQLASTVAFSDLTGCYLIND